MTRTLGQVIQAQDPVLAHQLAPGDGRVTAALARALMAAGQPTKKPADLNRLARYALRQDPTAVQAAVTLGLNLGLGGDVVGSHRLLDYAQKLSRRDLQTQLWAIEDSVGRGDVATALVHYDIALRTSTSAHDILFPVLSSAAVDQKIRIYLIKTLAQKPLWGGAFISWMANSETNPEALAGLFLGLQQAGVTLTPEALGRATDRLIALGSVDRAWRLYAATHPGTVESKSRDPKFGVDLSAPSAFDWQPVNDGTVVASIQRGGRGNVLDFSVPSGVGGALVRQMEMLPPGRYQILGHSQAIQQPSASLPYWLLTCADGREVVRVTVPNSSQSSGWFSGRFNVPMNCRPQTLALFAKSTDDIEGVTGQIDQVSIVPDDQ